jgi:hypothetical protein
MSIAGKEMKISIPITLSKLPLDWVLAGRVHFQEQYGWE